MQTLSNRLDTQPAPSGGGGPQEQTVPRDVYDLLGFRANVGAAPGDVLAAVRSILRGFGPLETGLAPGPKRYDLVAASPGWEVRVDDAVVHAGDDFLIALGLLEWHLVTDALRQRDDLFQLHGAALCVPMRRAGIVLVGDSGCGKTTLAMSLMLRGFVPFSDDVALLDPGTLELRTLRRAFHIASDTWRLLEPVAAGPVVSEDEEPSGYFCPPQWAEQAVPVRWMLFPEYEPGRSPQLAAMSPAEAAAAILSHTPSLARTARLALATISRLTARVACYRFQAGDLRASVEYIQRLVAAPPP